MTGSREARLLAALAAAAALVLAACAPAAPVRQATTGDATSTAPVVEPGPPPVVSIPIPTPAPPGVFPPLPPSILEGGDRLPTLQELMARGLSRDEALREQRRLGKELTERWRAEGRLGPPVPGAVVGPETAGSTISIAGKQITLPPDIYVENVIDIGQCQVGLYCPAFPFYALRRGDVIVSVDQAGKLSRPGTGTGWGIQPPPGFEFLEALAQ